MQISVLCGCLVGAWVYFWFWMHLQHCRPVFDLCSVLQLCLLKHFTCFHYRERSEVLGGKVVMKTVNFLVMIRIIMGCMQLLNSPWTFGLSRRKMPAIKPTDLHSFFFPLLSPNLLHSAGLIANLNVTGGWIRPLKSNTPQLCVRVELDLSWGEWFSWQLITFLQRSSLQPGSWNF